MTLIFVACFHYVIFYISLENMEKNNFNIFWMLFHRTRRVQGVIPAVHARTLIPGLTFSLDRSCAVVYPTTSSYTPIAECKSQGAEGFPRVLSPLAFNDDLKF